MPHSSDSESFESADEDVDRDVTVNMKSAASTSAKPAEKGESDNKLSETVAAMSVQEKDTNLPKAKTDSESKKPTAVTAAVKADENNDGWGDWDDDNDDEIVADPVVEKNVVPDAKNATSKPENTDSNADGWDDWGDETADEKPETNIKAEHKPTTPPQTNHIQTKANPLHKLCDEPAPSSSSSGGGGWGSWSPWGGVVTNLLSTATEGVASITSQVTSAIESGMGVPGPEEMARQHRLEALEKQQRLQKATISATSDAIEKQSSSPAAKATANDGSSGDDAAGSLLFGQLVSGVTQIGTRVISGGLGTLEGIGKKTMEVLQENDPGLRNKRRILNLDGNKQPGLSQILREAKESTEAAEANLKLVQKQQYKKQLHFETLFDDYHGLVHLEALEMLSRQSELKLGTLLAPLAGRALSDMQETLDEVKELCELPDSDTDEGDGRHSAGDLAEKFATATEDLDVPVEFTEIEACWQKHSDWLAVEENLLDAQQLHDQGLHCLAETTALAVYKLHKLAELLLVKERHSTANEADALVQLVVTVCWHLGGIATRFGSHLSQLDGKSDAKVNDLITSTFLEGSNSVSYIQNGFQLFVPILQYGAA